MADLTQTITNSLSILGGGPPSLWNTMEWGTDNWGFSDDLGTGFIKVISDSVTLSDVYVRSFIKIFGDTLTIDGDTPYIELFSGDYNYVFPGDKSNVVSQIVSDYTPASVSETSYTAGSISSTTWT